MSINPAPSEQPDTPPLNVSLLSTGLEELSSGALDPSSSTRDLFVGLFGEENIKALRVIDIGGGANSESFETDMQFSHLGADLPIRQLERALAPDAFGDAVVLEAKYIVRRLLGSRTNFKLEANTDNQSYGQMVASFSSRSKGNLMIITAPDDTFSLNGYLNSLKAVALPTSIVFLTFYAPIGGSLAQRHRAEFENGLTDAGYTLRASIPYDRLPDDFPRSTYVHEIRGIPKPQLLVYARIDTNQEENRDAAQLGGIDLNPSNIKLIQSGESFDFDINLDNAQFGNISIQDLNPSIISISPVQSLGSILGINQ